MIHIVDGTLLEYMTEYGNSYEYGDLWDYPLEEMGYLLSEHNGKTFMLINNRLYETDIE